ncbi:MAG TPA: branched-chain amino acid ABC transporter permease [Burkholderiaceae bacterium]|nr:branched-chain amino acid ABC transporter permease [Burkholderiaceae bacterium]HQR71114.1 branched-chain amino acid ABC transporter permease [Burkholderiaceae bacterium]
MTRRALLPWAVVVVAALLPWIAGVFDLGYYVGFVRRIMIFAIAAASLNFIMGFGGMVSLGHAAFFGLGAYAVGIAMAHGVASAWIAWPLAVLAAGSAALAIGAISLRTRGVYFIMITLAFAQMVYYLAVGLKQYGGEDGLTLPQRSTLGFGLDLGNEATLYYVVLAVLVVVMLFLNRAVDARYGRVLVGIRENETRMEAVGFATYRYRLAGFAIAGGLAGLAGALFANHNLFVSPAVLHWTQSATLVVMVLLGGLGYRYGGPAGAVALLVLEEVLAAFTDYWHLPLGFILLAVVFLAPRGLAGLLARRGTA